jgi:hypothetical protein
VDGFPDSPELYYATDGWTDEVEAEAAKEIARGRTAPDAWEKAKLVVASRRAAHVVPFSWMGRTPGEAE